MRLSTTRYRRLAGTLSAAALVAVGGAAPAAAHAQPSVDALIARAAATYKGARTATASFQQTLTNPMTGTRSVSRGVLQRQGGKFNFQFTDPRGDRLVADGEHLWVYTPSTTPRQVIKLPQAAAGAGMADPGLQFFDSPKTRFTITDAGTATVDGTSTRALTLMPKGRNDAFVKATVWLDPRDGTLRQFETTDGMGVTRRVVLTNVRTNVPVSAASFEFTPPAGVRVVDQKALMGGR